MRALLVVLSLLAACAAPPTEKPASEDPRLTGTRWVMVDAEDATVRPTIEFREAGRASGFSGCNQWFAQVDRANNGLRFTAIGMTRRACEPTAMSIEHDFADRLARTQAVRLDDNTLTLIGENGEALARLEPAR